jgi:hypothetical protein
VGKSWQWTKEIRVSEEAWSLKWLWSPIQRRSSKRMRRRDQRRNPHGTSSTRISWLLPTIDAQIQPVIINVAWRRFVHSHLAPDFRSISHHQSQISPKSNIRLSLTLSWPYQLNCTEKSYYMREKKEICCTSDRCRKHLASDCGADSGLRKFRLPCVTGGESIIGETQTWAWVTRVVPSAYNGGYPTRKYLNGRISRFLRVDGWVFGYCTRDLE